MKITFFLLAERGHVNPYIAPAQILQQRGHEVVMTSIGDLAEQMKKSGLAFSSDLVIPEVAHHPRGRVLVELVENPEKHRALIEQFFLNDIDKGVPQIQSFLKQNRPDLAIIDPMNYAAIIAATSLNIPWVGISSSLTSVLPDGFRSHVTDLVDLLAPARDKIFKKYGASLKFRAVDTLSPLLNISFSTEAFIGPAPNGVKAVGPSIPLQNRGDEVAMKPISKDKKVVYASFGSQVFYYPKIFKKIKTAVRGLPIQLVLSIGDLINEPGWEDTDSVQHYEYAPQLEILKHASLFITHGGANSVMEGLRAGVPLLINPICNDQIHQAFFIQRSQVGNVLNLKTAGIEEIRSGIVAMIEDPQWKVQVAQISKSYQINGAQNAADLIEEVGKNFES